MLVDDKCYGTKPSKNRVCVCVCVQEACVHAKLIQSLTLCNYMDCSLMGSSVSEILQARILEQVAMPSSRESSQSRDRIHVSYGSCLADRFFATTHMFRMQGNKTFSSVQFSSVTKSCPALCNQEDCSTPGFPVHHQLSEFTQTHVH